MVSALRPGVCSEQWSGMTECRGYALVILLTGGIPKRQLDLLAVDFDIGNVVLKDGGDVDLHTDESVSDIKAG